ncbi:MAG: septal ring lytic transglycosylase RlpA family protein [Bacteroidales bacterium]|nr:septal ring lytic transglycosylase RlpA family protein [Bacteroidales bacterium]
MIKIYYLNLFIILIFFLNIKLFSQENSVQYGKASFYADNFEGKITANGEKYSHSKFTAAHKTFSFGTMVKVTNLSNNKSVVVRINDRGPFINDRIIDVSKSAAKKLDFINKGVTEIKIELVNDSTKIDKSNKITQYNDIYNGSTEYYTIDIQKAVPAGYGIQIGSYSELDNLLRTAEELENIYDKNIIIQFAKINNKKKYRLIIGYFEKRKNAKAFQEKLFKTFPDNYIINFYH